MAKLYNRTKWPDDLLQRILIRTAKLTGARQANVIVKVTSSKLQGLDFRCSGAVSRCDHVFEKWVGDDYATDGGFVKLVLPRPSSQSAVSGNLAVRVSDFTIKARARVVYLVIVHEMHHLMEAQKHPELPVAQRHPGTYRRPPHRTRPEEIRAIAATKRVGSRLKPEDEALIDEIADVLAEREEQP